MTNIVLEMFKKIFKNLQFFLQVSIDKMDSLVDLSAELPRKFGFAPTNEEIYPNDAARKEARSKNFYFDFIIRAGD